MEFFFKEGNGKEGNDREYYGMYKFKILIN